MNPGDAVGAYRVLQKIGEGGMGEVYRASDAISRAEFNVFWGQLPPD